MATTRRRLFLRCGGFTRLSVGALRHRGVPGKRPVRACDPGHLKITGSAVWDNSQERWRLIDAQLDAGWQNRQQLDDGVLDIGRHRFLVVAMHGRTVVLVQSTRNYSASRSPSTTL